MNKDEMGVNVPSGLREKKWRTVKIGNIEGYQTHLRMDEFTHITGHYTVGKDIVPYRILGLWSLPSIYDRPSFAITTGEDKSLGELNPASTFLGGLCILDGVYDLSDPVSTSFSTDTEISHGNNVFSWDEMMLRLAREKQFNFFINSWLDKDDELETGFVNFMKSHSWTLGDKVHLMNTLILMADKLDV